MHNTLAITPNGLSLGFLDQQMYARTRKSNDVSNKQLPIEEKESYRWLKAMQSVSEADTASTRVVTVGDRESDIYELFHFGEAHHCEFVIRASWDRRLDQGRASVKKYLWGFMKKQRVLGTICIEAPTENGSTRTASVSLRSGKIKLKCPQRAGGRLSGNAELHAVWLKESRPPEGSKAIEWMLLTNIPTATLEGVLEKIAWYRTRWQIEVYHKVLKSGCKIEDCRLEGVSRLIRYITLMSVIAWRLYFTG